jgi:cysteinyl-tRNA synthetase
MLTNTRTKRKENFVPLQDKKVSLYVCGITPYDSSHVGHGRAYVTFDLLVRLLKDLNYDVTYVRNFTDIDDKLLAKAEKAGDKNKYIEIAEKFEQEFHDDMKSLNCLEPDVEPKVTEHIAEIIEFIQGLIDKNHAYIADNDVYFDTTSFRTYGQLSGKNLDDLIAGARVEVDQRKKNPSDFALWKGNDKAEFWKAPWGHGRPGWHIECSALVKKYLGESIDIHAGGMDLIFPHHENEVAQSESFTGKQFAKFWVHNAFVTIDKEKMSKSLDNFFTLRDVFGSFDPMVVRFYYLQHHYRSPLDFNKDALLSAQKAYTKLTNAFSNAKEFSSEDGKHDCISAMYDAVCDDLNTPKMLGILFENLSEIMDDSIIAGEVLVFLQDVCGLTLQPLKEEKIEMTQEVQNLISQREQARAAKDWGKADEIRDKLHEMGMDIQDNKL